MQKRCSTSDDLPSPRSKQGKWGLAPFASTMLAPSCRFLDSAVTLRGQGGNQTKRLIAPGSTLRNSCLPPRTHSRAFAAWLCVDHGRSRACHFGGFWDWRRVPRPALPGYAHELHGVASGVWGDFPGAQISTTRAGRRQSICGAVSVFYNVILRPTNEHWASTSSDHIVVRFPPPPTLFLIWRKAVAHASLTWMPPGQHGTGYASNRVSRAKRHTRVASPPPDSR